MITKSKKIKKGSRQTAFFLTFLFILFAGVAGLLIYSNVRINSKRSEMTSKIESLQAEIQKLEEEKARLVAGIENAQTDAYWDEKVREQGYKKSGEEQVVVLPPQSNQNESTQTQKSLWQRIIERLKF